MTTHEHDHDDEHEGFAYDRELLLGAAAMPVSRRRALGMFAAGAAGAATLLALPGRAGAATAAAATTKTPTETNGPYPADGSNGPNVLQYSTVFHRDLRSSFGTPTGVATGVDLRLALKVVHAATSEPYPGVGVYVWHCDSQGRYSLYSQGVTGENWLRGVQIANSAGMVKFQTVFPGCYAGRWPHIHFEVYPSRADVLAASNRLLTSQIALPQSTCEQVYAMDGYSGSAQNLSQVSLNSDMVFSDGYAQELASITGTPGKPAFKATLTIAI